MSSILIYGSPGSGKTTLAASMCKLGYHVHVLDFDRKVASMVNLKEYREKGQLSFWTPEGRLLEGALSDRFKPGERKPIKVTSKRPQGYVELVNHINELEIKPLPNASKTVLVLDSMTKVMEHLKRLTLHMSGKLGLEMQYWGTILANLEELFDCFYYISSTVYRHGIILAHDQVENDEVSGRSSIRPLIDGQMKNKAGMYVEEMYYTKVEVARDGTAEYKVLTKPIGRLSQARTSRALGVEVEADFSVLFKGEKA